MPLLATAIRNKKDIKIYGNYFNKKFNYSVRDYLHIDDFTNLIFKLLLSEKIKKGIYNVGSNRPISLKTIIEIFEKFSKQKIKFKIKKLRKGELNYTLCNNNKIKNKIPWRVKNTVEEIVKSSIRWANIK